MLIAPHYCWKPQDKPQDKARRDMRDMRVMRSGDPPLIPETHSAPMWVL